MFAGDSAEAPPGMTVVPTYRLYSPGQISGATFLGTPFAGIWLLAANYRRLREPAKARNTLIVGVLATLAFLAMAFKIGQSTGGRAPWLAIISVAAMSAIAKALQGEAFTSHTARGGKMASTWRSLGVSAIGLVVVVGGVFGYVWLAQPKKVAFGDSEVIYTDGGTKAEAKAVGAALTELEYFAPGRAVSVEVVHDHGRAVVGFVTQDAAFTDVDLQEEFHEIAGALSTKAFGGAPVDIWLIDGDRDPQVKLPWDERPGTVDLGDHHTVAYRHGAHDPDARLIGRLLQQRGYFTAGHGASVFVERKDGRAVVTFIVAQVVLDEPARQLGFHAYAGDLATEVFGGEPVDIWLADSHQVVGARLAWDARPGAAEAP